MTTNPRRRGRAGLRCAPSAGSVTGALVLALLGAAPAAAQPEPDEDLLVLRTVPRDYHEHPAPPSVFSGLLANSFTKPPVTVKPGQTLSGILLEHFNVSASWTPQVYDQFAQHVQRANGILDPAKDLKAGQVLVLPDMPRGAETPKAASQRNSVRAQMTFSTITSGFQLATPPKAVNDVPQTSAREIQIRSMKRSQYAELKVDPNATRSQMQEAGIPIPLQGALVANLSAGEPAAAPLDAGAKVLLTKLLRAPAKTRPFVLVLDDSWPSQEDFRRSVRFVLDAAAKIREAYSLQDSRGDSTDAATLKSELSGLNYGTTFCDSDCEYPRLKWHSAMVRKSLEDFNRLDTQGRVQVIYLPLNRAQRYGRNVLAEIIRVSLLADSVSTQLVLKTPAGNYPDDVQPGAADFPGIDKFVETLLAPDRLATMPLAHTAGTELRVSTDKAIVDAVVNFLVLYSAASQRPHFLSMSWTSPPNSLPAAFRDDTPYGLWVAAAGNNPKINVQADRPLFAVRSTTPGDFIAVQNTAEAGCDTSTLSPNPALHVYGLAFPGRVDADLCGTSFSTPRVAWLLALREAVKGPAVMPSRDESWTQWKAARMEGIYRMTRPNVPGEGRYQVSIPQLLNEPAN